MGWNLPQFSVGETHRRSWKLVSEIPSGTPGFVDFEASFDVFGTEMVLQISDPKLPVFNEEKNHLKNRDHDELPTQTIHEFLRP